MEPRDLIDYAAQDDGVGFRASLYAAIHDRVSAHIDAKKQEIAQGLVTQAESAIAGPDEEEVDEEELEEEVEQIDELSHDTLEKYKKAAAKDIKKTAPFGYDANKTDGSKTGISAKADKRTEKRISGYRKAWAKQDVKESVELQTEEAGQFRLISKHGTGKHTAKVYKDREWDEYRVRHYVDGKHHEPSDYHCDDLEDAKGTAEANLKFMNTRNT